MNPTISADEAPTDLKSVQNNRWRARLGIAGPPMTVFLLIVAAWQSGLVHLILNIEPYQLPYPSTIIQSLWDERDVMVNFGITTFVREAMLGYFIGSFLGLLAGFLFSYSTFLRRGIYPLVSVFNAMPITAFAPLMLLYFGFGVASKVAVVSVVTFAPMAVQSFKGFYSLDPLSHDLLKSYAASRWDIFVHFRFHSALPYIFTALRLNTTLSMIGAIIGEFFGAHGGLGFVMANSIHVFRMGRAWAAIATAATLGIVFYTLIGFWERRTIPWHSSFRSQ